ncbi:putative major facilitator superfamily transporter protein [Venturia nashicola]|uniref:Putative major facilitator superfamily transporter protein n=1 Tax=Venturia nashicola TaxID=86259 RepID=A0A4Z1NT16_9PEZI|nr:putative major facilitator superfamily transporter protein [Venturia nashicola]TLD29857.1 putative major facilitator superfamily transporter protein [Venturia nashicola]
MGADSLPVTATLRKRVLRVLFISLLLDLISFTFILPLFPKLLDFYRTLEIEKTDQNTLLKRVLGGLNAYKNSFSKPINDRYDIVLLGGGLGSLFSLCQAIASPVIGRLSDKHGRRTALLYSMVGNIMSVALWVAAVDFRTFLASRIVGGLSEGNVQLATAIATDISSDEQRGATMALVGACFSIAFTFGPALGAALSNITTFAANPFATAAGFSLLLIVTETAYLYFCLPETLPISRGWISEDEPKSNGHTNGNTLPQSNGKATRAKSPANEASRAKSIHKSVVRTNSHTILNLTHFSFILFFSGMEFSLPFMTWDLFQYTSSQSGRLLGFIGLIASLVQGGFVRRFHPLRVVQTGVVACAIAFILLGRLRTQAGLYGAASLLAVTSGTVVTGLNSLSSFEANAGERGGKLGNHRSFGQIGRALGPLIFCTLYWWAGREVAYNVGGAGIIAVCGLVFGALKMPPGTEMKKKVRPVATEQNIPVKA